MAEGATVGILRVLLTANTAEYETALKKAQQTAKDWSKDLKSIGQQTSAIGTSLTRAITVPLLGIGAGAAKLAIDFESAFAGVRKTVDGTVDQFGNLTKAGEEIRQGLRDMAKEIPTSVNELAKIAETAGQMGIGKDDILSFTRVMADLGVTTNLTADEAAAAVGRIQNIFGAAGKDTDRLGATIVALGNAGASTEKDIVEMGLRIAGAGHTVGLTQAQVLGFANALSSVGINAEAGGSAISRVFLKINDAVSKGGSALEGFAKVAGMTGAQFKEAFQKDAAGATVAFIEGIERLKGSGANVNAVLEDLVGKNIIIKDTLLRAAGAGNLLRESIDLGTKAWQDNTALINEARERYKTTEAQLTVLWNRIKDVGITLGNAMLPTINLTIKAFESAIPLVDALARGFASMPAPVQALTIGMGLLAAAIGPVLFVTGQLITSYATVLGAFTATGIATRTLAVVMPVLTAETGVLAMAMTALGRTVAIVGVALGSWQVGRWIGEWSGLTDAIGRATTKLGEYVRLLPEGSAAQYDASRAAAKLREEAEKHGPAFDAAAERAKQLRDQIKGDALTQDVQTLTKTLENLRAKGELSSGALARIAQAAIGLKSQHAQLPPVLEEIIKQYDKVGASSEKASDKEKNAAKKAQDAIEERARALREYYNFVGERQMEDAAREMEAAEAKKAIWRDYYNWLGERRMEDDARAEASRQQQIFAESAKMGDTKGGWELHPPVEEVRAAGKGLGTTLLGGIGETFKTQLGPTIMSAITGGGNIGQAIGGLLGQSITTNLSQWLSKNAKSFMESTLGQLVGSLLPGIGALLGPALGKVADWFKGLFGVSEEVKKSRTELEAFQKTLRSTLTDAQRAEAGPDGWRQDIIRVRDAAIATGNSVESALEAVEALWDTDHPERQRSAMEQIKELLEQEKRLLGETADEQKRLADEAEAHQRALQEQLTKTNDRFAPLLQKAEQLGQKLPDSIEKALRKLREMGVLVGDNASALDRLLRLGPGSNSRIAEIAQRLGIPNNALGVVFNQGRIGGNASSLINDLSALFADPFVSVGGVLNTPQVQQIFRDLVKDAITHNISLPSNLRPFIEELAGATGAFTNPETKERIDITQLVFGPEIKTDFDENTDALNNLITELESGDLLHQLQTGGLVHALGDNETIDALNDNPLIDALNNFKPDIIIRTPDGIPRDRGGYVPLAKGGLVTKPTFALIGESGPEAVIPWPRFSESIQPVPIPDAGSFRPWDTFDRTDDRDGNRDSNPPRLVPMPIPVIVRDTDDFSAVVAAASRHVKETFAESYSLDEHELSTRLTPVMKRRMGVR